ncbi:MAG: DsrE family protein [Thermomicrobiales bacterium]
MSARDMDETPHSRRDAFGLLGAGLAVAGGIALDAPRQVLAQEATPAPLPQDMAVPEDFRVVLHASLEQHWIYVINNLKNLTREWPKAKLRVVADGTAVYSLQGQNNLTEALAEFAQKGVEFQVCPNALHEHRIPPETVPSYAKTNFGGVVALVVAHQEGYVYIKP